MDGHTAMSSRRRWLVIALPVTLLAATGVASLLRLTRPGLDIPMDLVTAPIVLGMLSLFAAVALLAGHRLGWLLALSIVGWDLAASLVLWWSGQPQPVGMALTALSAALLTSPEMRALHDDVAPR
jgi:hypothetical protein